MWIRRSLESQTVRQGSNVTFDANISGDGLNYIWQFNGSNIAGATASTLVLTDVQVTQMGAYTVIASNAFGKAS